MAGKSTVAEISAGGRASRAAAVSSIGCKRTSEGDGGSSGVSEGGAARL
jgi:hypothetical protein